MVCWDQSGVFAFHVQVGSSQAGSLQRTPRGTPAGKSWEWCGSCMGEKLRGLCCKGAGR